MPERKSDLTYRAVVEIARLKADARWILQPTQRRRTTARMELALKGTDLPYHPGRFARQSLEFRAMTDSLLPHPEFWSRVRVDKERLARMHAAYPGRGVILTSVHAPTMWLSAASASGVLGYDIMWAVNEEIFAAPGETEGPTNEGIGGSTLIRAKDTYLMARERLRAGGMVGLLLDVPGPVEVTLMGKRASVHPWFAKLAKYQHAVIVPCLGIWKGMTMTLEVAEPIDPDDGGDIKDLCARAAASMDAIWRQSPGHWAPYTGVLWPGDVGPYRWAFDDDMSIEN